MRLLLPVLMRLNWRRDDGGQGSYWAGTFCFLFFYLSLSSFSLPEIQVGPSQCLDCRSVSSRSRSLKRAAIYVRLSHVGLALLYARLSIVIN